MSTETVQAWPPRNIPVDKERAIKMVKKLDKIAGEAMECRFETRHKRALRTIISNSAVLRQALNQTLPPVDLDELLNAAGAPFADEAPLERFKKVVALATGEKAAGTKINTRMRISNDWEHYGCAYNSNLSDFSGSHGYRGTPWVYKGAAVEKLAVFRSRISGYEARIRKGIQLSDVLTTLEKADVPQHRSGDLFKRIIMIGVTAREVQAQLDAENAPPKADRRRPALALPRM